MVETATDLLLGGRLKLEQPLRGHRAGTDAILLAAAVQRECEQIDEKLFFEVFAIDSKPSKARALA
jgi:hypothetical protein